LLELEWRSSGSSMLLDVHTPRASAWRVANSGLVPTKERSRQRQDWPGNQQENMLAREC